VAPCRRRGPHLHRRLPPHWALLESAAAALAFPERIDLRWDLLWV